MIMNDDDIYIVHPEKKHIVDRIPSSSAGYVDRYAPHTNKLVKSYLDRANAKHGNGHTAEKGMAIRHKNFKPITENTMDDLNKYKPFSGDLSSFRPAQLEEDSHDDGTKKSSGNAFDLAALKKKKEDEGANLRNHDKIKTSTGVVYKRKENAVGADTTDVKQPEKRGRGRPPGKYGSYKKRIKEALETYGIELDEEQIDELSKATLASYSNRALNDVRNSNQAKIRWKAASETGKLSDQEKAWKTEHERKAATREKGVRGAIKRLTKEDLDEMSADDFDALIEDFEQLDELSKATLASYVKKASKESDKAKKAADKADSKYDAISGKIGMARDKRVLAAQRGKGSGRIQSDSEVRLYGKLDKARREKYAALSLSKKRSDGISKANSRLTKEEVEAIEELSKKTLGSYIRRAAHDARNKEYYAGAEAIRSDNVSPGYGSAEAASARLKSSKKLADSSKKRQRGIDAATFRLTKEEAENRDIDNASSLTAKVKKKVALKDHNQNTKSFKLGESVIVGDKEGTVYSITENLVGVVHTDSDGVQFYNPQHISRIVEEDVDPTLTESVSWERWGDKPAPKESTGQWLISKHQTGYSYGHQEGTDHILVEGTGLDASKAGQAWAEEQGLEKVYVTESFAEKKEEGLTLNEIFNGALRI